MIAANLLLVNGKIWTVNPAQPIAQAVACLGFTHPRGGFDGERSQMGWA